MVSKTGVKNATCENFPYWYQGGRATGKLYFDVVGPPPNGVVYNAGGRDLLFWVR